MVERRAGRGRPGDADTVRRRRTAARAAWAFFLSTDIKRVRGDRPSGAGSGQALGRDRVWPTSRVARHRAPAVAELRGSSAGTRIVLAAMRPRLYRLGGAIADGVLLNWMLPAQAVMARRWVIEGADEEGRSPRAPCFVHPSPWAPARAAAAPRRGGHYRNINEAHRRHFEDHGYPARQRRCGRISTITNARGTGTLRCCARPSHRSAACRTGRSLAPSRGDRSRAVMATQPCDANA